MNKVILQGNFGKDAIVRALPNGGKVANMSIATTEYMGKDDNGKAKTRPEWHRIVAFGALAERAEALYKKGKAVLIEGRLQTRPWEDQKSGVTRYTTEIVASFMRLMGAPAPAPDGPPVEAYVADAQASTGPVDKVAQAAAARQQVIDGDEIPF